MDSIKTPADGLQRPPKLAEFAKMMLPGREETSRNMLEQAERDNYSRQVFRRWQPGDVYAPKDLSGPEQKKWKNARRTAGSDAFDTLGINPINEYKVRSLPVKYEAVKREAETRAGADSKQNFTMMSEYMTEMGRIKHSSQTGLRPVNQRKIAKAIRRAIGLGLMPSVHRHPLVLKKINPARFL